MLIPCAKSSPIPADANLPHQYCSLLLIYFNTIAAELVIKSMYIDVAPPCIVPDLNLYLWCVNGWFFWIVIGWWDIDDDWFIHQWLILQYYINAISQYFFVIIIVILMKWHYAQCGIIIIFFFGSKVFFQYMEWCKCRWRI